MTLLILSPSGKTTLEVFMSLSVFFLYRNCSAWEQETGSSSRRLWTTHYPSRAKALLCSSNSWVSPRTYGPWLIRESVVCHSFVNFRFKNLFMVQRFLLQVITLTELAQTFCLFSVPRHIHSLNEHMKISILQHSDFRFSNYLISLSE